MIRDVKEVYLRVDGDGNWYLIPKIVAEVFDKDGWFLTGDIGRIEDGKFLYVTDRKKEMFKLSNGKYVAPQSIEGKLKESVFVDQVMVVGEHEKALSKNFKLRVGLEPHSLDWGGHSPDATPCAFEWGGRRHFGNVSGVLQGPT